MVEERKPYLSSHFLPGKLEGKPVQLLIDTWCTTKRHVFERLPQLEKNRLWQSDPYELMANDTRLQFYGLLSVTGRFRDVDCTNTFIVGQIKEDVTLGMPFLVQEECNMRFGLLSFTLKESH